MTIADLIIKFYEWMGIDHVFTVSGGGSIFLCDSLKNSRKINYICCHHEQGAIFAAEGYARAAGKVGGVLVTTGPGGTNIITGLNSAFIEGTPLFVVSGQVFSNQRLTRHNVRQYGLQESNIVELSKSVTKQSTSLEKSDDVVDVLKELYEIMISGRPGPVLLDIPADLQKTVYKGKTNFYFFKETNPLKENTNKFEERLGELNKIIKKSEKPILLVGNGINNSKYGIEILKHFEALGIPLLNSWNASSIDKYSNYLGTPGMFSQRYPNCIINKSDLILVLGCRLHIGLTGYNIGQFFDQSRVIWVDIDESELKKYNSKNILKINSNIDDLYKVLERLEFKKSFRWLEKCQLFKSKVKSLNISERYRSSRYIDMFDFLDVLYSRLDADDIIITDMGLSFVGTHQYPSEKGINILTSSGHAPMGWGLPAAIGSFLANTYNRVICICGEGGLMMNIQELSTLMHNEIEIDIYLLNNGGYQTIKHTQNLGFAGNLMGCDKSSGISFPRFDKISQTFNLNYKLVRSIQDLEMQKTYEKKSNLYELIIDPEQEHGYKLINKRNEEGEILSPEYTEFYPDDSQNMLNTLWDEK